MEARVIPYDVKPCDGWAVMRDLLDHTTLLLVAQVGPTVFNVRDQEGCCWRVTVGNPHNCSCPSSEPFCVHLVYVILKVLQVPTSNPLAWQRSYTDSDIDQVLAGRTRQMERRMAFRRARTVARTGPTPAKVTRHAVFEDKICPICQDEFGSGHDVSWCKTGCGNNMHISCMITYAEYKLASDTAVTCPLCRDDWGRTILHSLKQDRQAGRPAIKLAAVRCSVCRMNARSSKFFRCLDCTKPDLPFEVDIASAPSGDEPQTATERKRLWTPTKQPVDICAACHRNLQDVDGCARDHTLVTSDASASCWEFKWEAAPRPERISGRVIEELQSREFTANDYQRLLELCQQAIPPPLHSYLVQWLREGPELEEKCGLCSEEPPAIRSSRMLACGHRVHHHCVLNAVTVHQAMSPQGMDILSCPQCKNPLFSALTRRPVPPKKLPKPPLSGIGNDVPVRGVALGRSHSFTVPSVRETNGKTLAPNRLIALQEENNARNAPMESFSRSFRQLAIGSIRERQPPPRLRRHLTPVRSRTAEIRRSTQTDLPTSLELVSVQAQQRSNSTTET